MDFTVTLPNGTLAYSGDDARYTIDEESAVLTVTDGVQRWRYSPAGWLSVADIFGDPAPAPASAP